MERQIKDLIDSKAVLFGNMIRAWVFLRWNKNTDTLMEMPLPENSGSGREPSSTFIIARNRFLMECAQRDHLAYFIEYMMSSKEKKKQLISDHFHESNKAYDEMQKMGAVPGKNPMLVKENKILIFSKEMRLRKTWEYMFDKYASEIEKALMEKAISSPVLLDDGIIG